MSERLTPEREAEIRGRLEAGCFPLRSGGLYAIGLLLAEIDALRVEREAKGAVDAVEGVVRAAREVRRGCWRCSLRSQPCEDCGASVAPIDALAAAVAAYDERGEK